MLLFSQCTIEGANISFNCVPGLEPQRDDVSVCSSNGSWVPDPAHRICSTSKKDIIMHVEVSIHENYVYILSYPIMKPSLLVEQGRAKRDSPNSIRALIIPHMTTRQYCYTSSDLL